MPRRGHRIAKLEPYRLAADADDFASLPPSLRPLGRLHCSRLLAKWRAHGRPKTGRRGLAHAIAADLVLHPRDLVWGRRMKAIKAGGSRVAVVMAPPC